MPVVSTWEEKTGQRRKANEKRRYVTTPSKGLKKRYEERMERDAELLKELGIIEDKK